MQRIKTLNSIVIVLSVLISQLWAGNSKMPYDCDWHTAAVQANNVQQYTFHSKIVKQTVSYHVFMPSQLNSYTGPVPTLIWLHGSFSTLQGIEPFSNYLQKAMDEGRLKPMAVVFPNGLNQSLWVNSKNAKYPVEDVLMTEMLPDLKNHFNYQPNRIKPKIAGFSMGGYGAARLLFKFPNVFEGAIAIASGPLNENFVTTSSNKNQREVLLDQIFDGDMNYYLNVNPRGEALKFSKASYRQKLNFTIVVGEIDKTFQENQRFSEYLNDLGIKHTFITLPGVDHEMPQVLKAGEQEIFDIWNGQISTSLKKYRKKQKSRRQPKHSSDLGRRKVVRR